MEIHLIGLFLATFVPAVAMPGPNSAFVVAQTLRYGVTYGALAPVGFAIATGLHSLIVFSGLGLLLSAHAEAFLLIKWLGVMYLLWMAYKSFSKTGSGLVSNSVSISKSKIIGHAVFVSLTNPKAVLVSTLVFPLYIDPDVNYTSQAMTIGICAMFASFSIYLVYALMASKLADKLRNSKGANKILGAIYAGAGVTLAAIHK